MATTDIPRRMRTELEALAHGGLDSFAFRERALALLGEVMSFDAAWWWTIDPSSGFFTSGVFEPMPTDHELCRGFHSNEYGDTDVNKFRVLARSPAPVGVLGAATGGRPELSERYRELLVPLGFEREMRVALGEGPTLWGGLALLREPGRADFTAAEADAMVALAGTLTRGLRLGIVLGATRREAPPTGPGVVIVDGRHHVITATAAAEQWLDEMPGERFDGLPEPVHAALNSAPLGTGDGARIRLRGLSGRWLSIHASRAYDLDGRPTHTAVVIEEAGAGEVAPLLLQGFALSQGESRVTRLVLQGHSTKEIGSALHLSPYTVQDHLKAIFAKVGVRSRRELVARIFEQHHIPRFGYGSEHPEADGAVAGAYAAVGA